MMQLIFISIFIRNLVVLCFINNKLNMNINNIQKPKNKDKVDKNIKIEKKEEKYQSTLGTVKSYYYKCSIFSTVHSLPLFILRCQDRLLSDAPWVYQTAADWMLED